MEDSHQGGAQPCDESKSLPASCMSSPVKLDKNRLLKHAVQKMAEAHMQNLGVYPPLEDPYEVDEDEDNLQRQEGEDTSLAKAADQQDTAASENSVRFCETVNQIPAAPEEEEEGGGKVKETTEGSSRGGN